MSHIEGPWLLELKEGIGGQVSLFVTPRGREVAAVYGRDDDVRVMLAAPDMLAALLNVRKLISEAAMTGFNCHDGDWAERLFASQATTSNAIAKAAKLRSDP